MDDAQERLVAQGLKSGNRDAWQMLYNAYVERVWRAVARLVGSSSADVADIVQETFLAAARSARGFDESRGTLWIWLWGIARNTIALHYRKQERHDRVKLAQNWLALENGRLQKWMDGQETSPIDDLETRELAGLVRAVLNDLPAEQSDLLIGKYLDALPVAQLARQKRCSEVALRSRLARARTEFREAFARRAAATNV
jgi:RNA polymerase sigma-70 factor (ECF subfamily)